MTMLTLSALLWASGLPPFETEFQSLFDGQTLKGWMGDTTGYVVRNGAITVTPQGRNLYTTEEYADFILRFDFKLTPGANNGLGIRTPPQGDAAYLGMELQILDSTHKKWANLKDWQYHGSCYGVAPAEQGHLMPTGSWNRQEVTVKGSQVRVVLNGATILDVDLDDVAPKGKTIDGQDPPGLRQKAGHICFCGHGDEVAFRNIRIKKID